MSTSREDIDEDTYVSSFGTYDDPVIQKVISAALPVTSLLGQDEVKRDGQRVAAVLIPLVQRGDDWHIILTQRPDTMPSHPGQICLLYTSPSPRDQRGSRMPSSA